jgi:hypothetical protein
MPKLFGTDGIEAKRINIPWTVLLSFPWVRRFLMF